MSFTDSNDPPRDSKRAVKFVLIAVSLLAQLFVLTLSSDDYVTVSVQAISAFVALCAAGVCLLRYKFLPASILVLTALCLFVLCVVHLVSGPDSRPPRELNLISLVTAAPRA